MANPTFISADLTLPAAPEHHKWVVDSSIQVKPKKTVYRTVIRLIETLEDGEEVTVLLHGEKWDREKEPINDFLAVLVDEVTRRLNDYISFSSVDWAHHNPEIDSDNPLKKKLSDSETLIERQWS